MGYSVDKKWSNKIHELALDTIYKDMNWHVIEEENDELKEYKDNTDGIDYTVMNQYGDIMLVQERFRRDPSYNDFTLRFEREHSIYETEKKSEFYKIKDKIMRDKEHKFLLLYGVSTTENDFDKYVIVNLKQLYKQIDLGNIVIDRRISFTQIINGVVHVGVINNHDPSSSFLVFDVGVMAKFPNIIVKQEGFNV